MYIYLQVNLSFFGTGAILDRASTEGGGLSYNPMFAAMKALGVVCVCVTECVCVCIYVYTYIHIYIYTYIHI